MIDFAADSAAIFGDPQGFAGDAQYFPGGGPAVTIRVIPTRPDETVGFGGSQIQSETATFLASVVEMPDPRAGELLIFGDTDYIIQGKPQRDELRLTWRIDTRPT